MSFVCYLFEWLYDRGKEEGFSASLSAYTPGSPRQGRYTDEILSLYPDMAGRLPEENCMDPKADTPGKEIILKGQKNMENFRVDR